MNLTDTNTQKYLTYCEFQKGLDKKNNKGV